MDKRYIVKIRRVDKITGKVIEKEFITYQGLLDTAHKKGIKSMIVDIVQFPSKENENTAICKAVIEGNNGEKFIDFGDANPKNVSLMIVTHILRMASTRAKARVLRDFTGFGMTYIDELSET